MRIWLEDGTPPERGRDLAIAHATAAAGLVGALAYQRLVPKLWKCDADEVAIWEGLGLSHSRARKVVRAVGVVELGFALTTAARSGKRWPYAVAIAAMPTLAVGAAVSDRRILAPKPRSRASSYGFGSFGRPRMRSPMMLRCT